MIKPRLLSHQFIEKITQEQKSKISTLKSMFLSKNFYIFIGIMILFFLLFMIYRYFEKKERVEQQHQFQIQEKYQEKSKPILNKKQIMKEEEEFDPTSIEEEEIFEVSPESDLENKATPIHRQKVVEPQYIPDSYENQQEDDYDSDPIEVEY